MRLTTKGRYAVTAMLDLALHEGGSPVSLSDISARHLGSETLGPVCAAGHRLEDEGVFGLEDFGAEVAQEHGGERAGPDHAEVDDSDAFEGFRTCHAAPPEAAVMAAGVRPTSAKTSAVCWPRSGAARGATTETDVKPSAEGVALTRLLKGLHW